MINSVNRVSNFYYPRNNSMFPRDKMPKYTDVENYTNRTLPTAQKSNFYISPEIIAKSRTIDAQGDRKVKVVSTAAKAEEDKVEVSEKSLPEETASIAAKESLYQLTKKNLFKGNPYLIAATLLGVDFEEDGNAFKNGAETGKIGDFKGDYNKFFDEFTQKASKSNLDAFLQGLSLPTNFLSVGIADCMQTAGMALSKVLGKDLTAFVGSGVATAGTALNAIGDIGASTLKGTVGTLKNLFTGDFDGVADSATDIYNGVKDGVVDVANSVADTATDGANMVANAAEDAYNGVADAAEEVGNAVGDVAEDAYNGVTDAAEEVGNAVGDAAEEVGDAICDAGEEVVDFFDSIF